jgi:tetratricopeptide (TPR) repeat protein
LQHRRQSRQAGFLHIRQSGLHERPLVVGGAQEQRSDRRAYYGGGNVSADHRAGPQRNVHKAGQELEPLLRRIEETKSGPVSLALFAMGVVKRLAGEYEEALRLQQASLDSMQESARSTLAGTRVLTEIGLNQLELGKYDAAESSLARALARFQSLQKRVTPDRADAIQGLGRVRMAQSSRIAKMRRSRHEALEGLRVRAGIN